MCVDIPNHLHMLVDICSVRCVVCVDIPNHLHMLVDICSVRCVVCVDIPNHLHLLVDICSGRLASRHLLREACLVCLQIICTC